MRIVPPVVGMGKGESLNQSHFFDPSQPVAKMAGKKLPHWDQDGKLQFVTFRLIDSLPQSELRKLEEIGSKIENGYYVISDNNQQDRLNEINYWLDKGVGECILKYEPVLTIVEEALNFYDGIRWDLYDYVIMPNHVHLIVLPYEDLRVIMGMLFHYTTRQINKLMQREGRVWQHDYFDRLLRDVNDYNEKAAYIRANPHNLK